MRVMVIFCSDADVIECPNDIIKEIEKYRVLFIDWLYNTENNHGYWHYSEGRKLGCCYRSEAFVEWLNTFILGCSDEKAMVIEQYIRVEKNLMTSIHF